MSAMFAHVDYRIDFSFAAILEFNRNPHGIADKSTPKSAQDAVRQIHLEWWLVSFLVFPARPQDQLQLQIVQAGFESHRVLVRV